MTVKLAKLFGSGNNGAVVGGSTGMGTAGGVGGGGGGVGTGGKSVSNQMENHAGAMDNNKNQEGMPPPLPPPNENMQKFHYKYYDHGIYGHAYMCQDQDMDHDQDEDDYDTALQRNHPYNNSQRPLLGDRRPTIHHNLTLIKMQKPLPPVTPPRPSHSAAYISPYVQQQKRDSAKGLHGFNDFDALSQEYNRHLQSPHIGYPYGSPPSPTNTNSHHHQQHQQQQQQQQSSDFCFDHRQLPPPPPSSSSTSSNCSYGHAAMVAASSSSSSSFPSRFEDDFCKRNNSETSGCNLIGTTGGGGGTGANGPFIFGVSHVVEPSRDYGCTVIDSSAASPARQVLHHNDTQQSLSDTSADSSSGKGAKFLLRKRKSKKTQAATAAAAATGPATASTKEGHKGPPSIKCVLVGDGAVGKTNLILSYLENRFQVEHVPTASDIYNADVNVNDSPVHLTLCDTAGQDTLDPLRELCYPDSDVFLLCFSVVKPETFRAIKSKWAPKFAKSTAALILVGTQADLRANPNVLNKLQTNGEKAISYADAWDLATTIGAKYIETSSATQDKVKDVFDAAIWEGLVPTTLPPTPSFWRKLFCLA